MVRPGGFGRSTTVTQLPDGRPLWSREWLPSSPPGRNGRRSGWELGGFEPVLSDTVVPCPRHELVPATAALPPASSPQVTTIRTASKNSLRAERSISGQPVLSDARLKTTSIKWSITDARYLMFSRRRILDEKSVRQRVDSAINAWKSWRRNAR